MKNISRALHAFPLLFVFSLGLGCSLLQVNWKSNSSLGGNQAEEEPPMSEEEKKKRAEQQAKEDQELIDSIAAARAEVGKGGNANAQSFAVLVIKAENSRPARDGRLDMKALVPEAAGYLEKAIAAEPSLESFDLLVDLPGGAEVDEAVVRSCPKVRSKVQGDGVMNLTGICLKAAGGDAKKLSWPNAQKDVSAYKKAEAERLAAEERAQAAAAAVAAEQARYAAAAVFASGRCNFGNCLKDGWTTPSPQGDIQVRCDFQDCFKNGWTARFPDGREARTRCNFQDCMKDGWETQFPDGKTARTRCSFQKCLTDGWETELPGGGTARTRCSFQNCEKDGWETDMPDGKRVQCRCNFQKCFENGATCG